MTITIKAVYKRGVLDPLEPLELLDGTPVQVIVEPLKDFPDPTLAADDPYGAFPELDLEYETIEALTRAAWEDKADSLLRGLKGA